MLATFLKWKPCHCSKNLKSQCKSLSGAQKTTLKAKSTKRPYQFAQGSNFTDIFSSLYPFLPNRTSTTLWGIFWEVKNSNQNSVVFSYLLISQARQHSQRSVAYYWSYPQIGHCSGTRGQHIRFWANGQSKTAATNFSQIHGNKDQRGHLWLSIKTVTKIDWSHAGVPLDNLSFGLGKKHFCYRYWATHVLVYAKG